MKKALIALALAAGLATSALAQLYSANLADVNLIIPDGDLNGVQSSQTFSGLSGAITHVTLSLDISGGYNGDLYAYLWHNNTLSVLLNRVGRTGANSVGYLDAGFGPATGANSFLFDDSAAHDIHLYRTFAYTLTPSRQLTGAWQPDGRFLDPLSAGALFNTADRASTLSVFNGMDPNGLWLLYLADVSPGGEARLNSWGLEITTVPEPSMAALLLLGLAALARLRPRD